MRLLTLLILLGVCSLVSSCKNSGPQVVVCIIDSEKYGMQCSDSEGNSEFIDISDANNYVCLSPNDFQMMISYLKERCRHE